MFQAGAVLPRSDGVMLRHALPVPGEEGEQRQLSATAQGPYGQENQRDSRAGFFLLLECDVMLESLRKQKDAVGPPRLW